MKTVRAAAEDGFTMIELLISLSIMGLLVGAIYGCFFSGVRGWQKGAALIDHQQSSRIAVDKIVRELRYACLVEAPAGGAELHFRLAGDRKSYCFKRIGPAGDDLVMIHRQAGGTATQTKIALEITALDFFIDENNRVTITLTSGSGPDSFSVYSGCRPRNIP